MTETQLQIERLRSLKESYNELVDLIKNQLPALALKIDNIDFTPIENKVDEGVSTLSDKIGNIKLPEVDLSNVAKQGENQEATNSKILEEMQNILSRSVKYDKQSGNLIIENVKLIIE